jgi:Helix-turn-helix domain
MKRTSIRILYLGHGSATPKLLSHLLGEAGYSVTVERQNADGRDGLPSADLVAASDVRAASGKGRGKPARRSTPDRIVVVTGRSIDGGADPRRTGGRARPEWSKPMNLQELREHVRKTQGDVARRAAVSQPQLSRVEGRRDHLVSTLRKYVRALGGDVQVVAEIGSERILLRDV